MRDLDLFLAVAILLLFIDPDELLALGAYFGKLIQIWCLNYFLMAKAYFIHRQICSDLRKLGLPVPPFRFTPIWQRPQ